MASATSTATATATATASSEVEKNASFRFVSRVSHMPLVGGALNLAGKVYQGVKQSNIPVVPGLVTAAESKVKQVVEPLLEKHHQSLVSVDQYALGKLDQLETAVDAVHRAANGVAQTVAERKNAVRDTASAATTAIVDRVHAGVERVQAGVHAGVECVQAGVHAGVERVQAVVPEQVATRVAETAQSVTAAARPIVARLSRKEITAATAATAAAASSKVEEVEEETAKPRRALAEEATRTFVYLRDTVSRAQARVFARAMSQLGAVRTRSAEAVERMRPYVVDLLQYDALLASGADPHDKDEEEEEEDMTTAAPPTAVVIIKRRARRAVRLAVRGAVTSVAIAAEATAAVRSRVENVATAAVAATTNARTAARECGSAVATRSAAVATAVGEQSTALATAAWGRGQQLVQEYKDEPVVVAIMQGVDAGTALVQHAGHVVVAHLPTVDTAHDAVNWASDRLAVVVARLPLVGRVRAPAKRAVDNTWELVSRFVDAPSKTVTLDGATQTSAAASRETSVVPQQDVEEEEKENEGEEDVDSTVVGEEEQGEGGANENEDEEEDEDEEDEDEERADA